MAGWLINAKPSLMNAWTSAISAAVSMTPSKLYTVPDADKDILLRFFTSETLHPWYLDVRCMMYRYNILLGLYTYGSTRSTEESNINNDFLSFIPQ
mmetsp:Transcript_31969/g.46041  ORF Transcript_31969/g.46041 Transcript_31969/m.46041 type:complete len:96 (+) Transcript_31969:201-488(+)